MIDEKMVAYIADLSRINLSAEQAALMQSELQKVLTYMEILQSVDTAHIEPLSHVFSVTNQTRPDIVGGHFSREKLLQNAPDCTDEAFVVPKAVDAS